MKQVSAKHFSQARFVTTAVEKKGYPRVIGAERALLPEVAVLGRSNVGKSSLLNDLFQKKGLVKTSSNPGKTQALHFFSADDRIIFADLPGYGYANVPSAVRKRWGPMTQTYLMERESLKLLLFLFDIRRIPNEDDFLLLEWIRYIQKPMLFVLTKIDKLPAPQREKRAQEILHAFGDSSITPLYFSATKSIGRDALIQAILTQVIN